MPIDVNIQAGYPTGSVGTEQGSVTVAIILAWDLVPGKLAELFPSPSAAGPGANKLDPIFGFYRCQTVEFKPIGAEPDVTKGGAPFVSPYDATFTLPYYELALLTITYSSVQVEFPNQSSDTPDTSDGSIEILGLTHQLSSGGEVITLDESSLFWSDYTSAKGTSVTSHKVIPTLEHNIKWKRVLSPPWEAMRTLIGKVNDMDLGPFQTGTMLEETLLYVGFSASPDITADGTRVWEIDFKFSERRVDELAKATIGGSVVADGITGYTTTYGGWNHFWKQEEDKVMNGATPPAAVDNPVTSGFRRLHSRKPANAAAALVYLGDTAIFKKGSLETFFVQV